MENLEGQTFQTAGVLLSNAWSYFTLQFSRAAGGFGRVSLDVTQYRCEKILPLLPHCLLSERRTQRWFTGCRSWKTVLFPSIWSRLSSSVISDSRMICLLASSNSFTSRRPGEWATMQFRTWEFSSKWNLVSNLTNLSGECTLQQANERITEVMKGKSVSCYWDLTPDSLLRNRVGGEHHFRQLSFIYLFILFTDRRYLRAWLLFSVFDLY